MIKKLDLADRTITNDQCKILEEVKNYYAKHFGENEQKPRKKIRDLIDISNITRVLLQKRKRNCFQQQKQSVPTSINDVVEMTVTLFNMFSIYAKMQGFRDKWDFAFYTEIQDGHPKWWENDFWRKSPDDSVETPGSKICKNHSISHRF